MKTIRTLIAAACVLPLFIPHSTIAVEPSLFSLQLSKAQHIRGLKVPLGTENNPKPTASVYFGVISIESKRAGFLRIGPIPQLVVSGMRVDILESEGGASWAADLARFAEGDVPFERMSIRGIEFRSPVKDRVSVRADEAQFIALTRTFRLRGVDVHVEGQTFPRIKAAEIHLEGAKAGRIEWHDGERTQSISLSGPSSTQGGSVRLTKD